MYLFFLDGCTTNSEYRDAGDGSQSTMVATVMQTVCIRAELQVGDTILTEDLWQNQSVNSWMSVVPIKYSLHKESIGTLCSKIRKKVQFITVNQSP